MSDRLLKKREWYREYKTTLNGYCRLVYGKQKSSSALRNMAQPDYSFEEFQEWVGSQDRYWELRAKFQQTGDKRAQPSVDRIDGSKPYTLDNLQILTLWNNLYIKGSKEAVAGLNKWQQTEEGKEYLKKFAGKGKARKWKTPFRNLICRECGAEYTTNGIRSFYCSRKCGKRAWRRNNARKR